MGCDLVARYAEAIQQHLTQADLSVHQTEPRRGTNPRRRFRRLAAEDAPQLARPHVLESAYAAVLVFRFDGPGEFTGSGPTGCSRRPPTAGADARHACFNAARHQKLACTVNLIVRPAPGMTWFSDADV